MLWGRQGLPTATIPISDSPGGDWQTHCSVVISVKQKICSETARGKSPLFLIHIRKVSITTCEREIMTGE